MHVCIYDANGQADSRRWKKDLYFSIAMANAFPNCTVHAVDCDQVFTIIININIIVNIIININVGIILMIIKMIRLLGFNREGKAEHKSS